MKIFVTGATGYIGGSVAVRLAQAGHTVRGLCRDPQKAGPLRALGIEPVAGALHDEALLKEEALRADAVINAADADDPYALQALLAGLHGSGRRLIHTSGSSVVGDRAAGAPSERVFTEDTPRPVRWEKRLRCETDAAVVSAAGAGVASVVLCPCLVYGAGLGLNPESIQVPGLIRTARQHGAARYIGAGQNRWSTVHIGDLVEAYVLALTRAPAGSFFFVENGEIAMATLAQRLHEQLGFEGKAQSWSAEEAAGEWGREGAHFAFGSNSRVSSLKLRAMLGWNPRHASVLEDLPRCIRSLEAAAR
ncbi:MAG TPA: NAD-dependent epimerase/dehydratase family protein [Opitutaceae bacterium]